MLYTVILQYLYIITPKAFYMFFITLKRGPMLCQ